MCFINDNTLLQVQLVRAKFNGVEVIPVEKIPIGCGINKNNLITLMKQNDFSTFYLESGEMSWLEYYEKGIKVEIIIGNYTSDVYQEWFRFNYSDTIIIESIGASKSLTDDYNDERLEQENNGIQLSQEDYIKTISDSKVSSLLKQAEG